MTRKTPRTPQLDATSCEHVWDQVLWREKNGRYERGFVCMKCPTAGWGEHAEPDKLVTIQKVQWHWWHDRLEDKPWTPWPDETTMPPIDLYYLWLQCFNASARDEDAVH